MVNHSEGRFKKWTLSPRVRLLVVVIWIVGILSGCFTRFALVRISVVDEETGEPVSFNRVDCFFHCINYDMWGPPKANRFRGKIIGDGNILWLLGHGNAPSVHAGLHYLPGNYYSGHGAQKSFWKISYLFPLPIWLPPVRTLRIGVLKKQNPISMYNGSIVAPYLFDYPKAIERRSNWTESISYDCIVGDWCAPYGRGQTNDLVFTYKYDYFGSDTNQGGASVVYYQLERKLSFSNPGDGVQPVPKTNYFQGRPNNLVAPIDGYTSESISYYGKTLEHGWSVSDDTHAEFYFRVRTTADKTIKLPSGYYGRMWGRYSGYLGLQMKYILNPTPLDTNLEYNGNPLKPPPIQNDIKANKRFHGTRRKRRDGDP